MKRLQLLVDSADGDARRALNLLDIAADLAASEGITGTLVRGSDQRLQLSAL